MPITEKIDKRIEELTKKRSEFLKRNLTDFANQTWARIEELKSLKNSYTDRDGNWLNLN